jgi:ATP-dependent Clp protease adapter protein ClpS
MAKTKTKDKKVKPGSLPQWKVLLHKDDIHSVETIRETILSLTRLPIDDAQKCAEEVHSTGVSVVLVTHKEKAELYQELFEGKDIKSTIEPN